MPKQKKNPAVGELEVDDVRCFVPARDFSRSRRFYEALGWSMVWTDDEGLALMELGGHRFMLQNFYQREWATNFVISIVVRDAAAWYEHIVTVVASDEFPSARVETPRTEAFGAIVTYVWDPSGVLLQFTEFLGQ